MRAHSRFLAAAAWLGAALLAACATDPPPLESAASAPYRLGSGDVVQLAVFGDPTISGNYRVDDSGRISVPLAGAVELGGRTLREGEQAIAQRMRAEGVLTDPRISLNIQEYRNIYVMGEVARGGGFQFSPGMTANQAIAIAGGYSPRAKRDLILVTRPGTQGERRASGDTVLQAGDVVTIPERWF
jgi:polysaccharide export outer membrane protein